MPSGVTLHPKAFPRAQRHDGAAQLTLRVKGAKGTLAVNGKAGANSVRYRRRGLSKGPHRLVVSAAGRTASVSFGVLR